MDKERNTSADYQHQLCLQPSQKRQEVAKPKAIPEFSTRSTKGISGFEIFT